MLPLQNLSRNIERRVWISYEQILSRLVRFEQADYASNLSPVEFKNGLRDEIEALREKINTLCRRIDAPQDISNRLSQQPTTSNIGNCDQMEARPAVNSVTSRRISTGDQGVEPRPKRPIFGSQARSSCQHVTHSSWRDSPCTQFRNNHNDSTDT